MSNSASDPTARACSSAVHNTSGGEIGAVSRRVGPWQPFGSHSCKPRKAPTCTAFIADCSVVLASGQSNFPRQTCPPLGVRPAGIRRACATRGRNARAAMPMSHLRHDRRRPTARHYIAAPGNAGLALGQLRKLRRAACKCALKATGPVGELRRRDPACRSRFGRGRARRWSGGGWLRLGCGRGGACESEREAVD